MRPWVLEDLLKVLTSLWPDQVSKLLEDGELVRLSVSPSRESPSWVREASEVSWGGGGFFRTPAYRAELSSHVAGDSRFRKSTGPVEGRQEERLSVGGIFYTSDSAVQ